MTENTSIITIDPALAVLSEEDQQYIVQLSGELRDTWEKRQVFRTETEMRVSVLSDGKHPTNASKYWQCVREQAVMLDNLVELSFLMRRNEIKQEKVRRKLDNETNDLKVAMLQVDLDELAWLRKQYEQQAKDRVREIRTWSQLKAELDTGDFDTQDVNTHQMESLKLRLMNRVHSLTQGSSQAEVLNVLGPLSTIERLQGNQPLPQVLTDLKVTMLNAGDESGT